MTGYPWSTIDTPSHKAFINAYQKRFNDYPRLGSIVGYSQIKAIAEGAKKAKSTETEKMVAAFKGLSFESPFGKVTFRAEDQQSTMGAFVGKIKNDNGKGVMVDYKYMDGARFQPTNEEVKKLRPAD